MESAGLLSVHVTCAIFADSASHYFSWLTEVFGYDSCNSENTRAVMVMAFYLPLLLILSPRMDPTVTIETTTCLTKKGEGMVRNHKWS